MVIKSPGEDIPRINITPTSIGLFKRKAIGYFIRECWLRLDHYGGKCVCDIHKATLDKVVSMGFKRKGKLKKEFMCRSYFQVWENESGQTLKEYIH